MTESVLSTVPDGAGYHYGRLPDDGRQINVRKIGGHHIMGPQTGAPWSCWEGFVSDDFQCIADTFAEAERRCVEWIKQNPEPME